MLSLYLPIWVNSFLEAVHTGNEDALTKVSGIGAKKAEQMIVQLKHKVAKLIDSGAMSRSCQNFKQLKNVSDVLNSLNYSRSEISSAVDYVRSNYSDKDYSFDQMLRQALSFLSRRA